MLDGQVGLDGRPGGGAEGSVDGPAAWPPRVTVLIPAHDEGERITAGVSGLWRQTLPPTRIVVVADNCSDDTAFRAKAAGAEVFETSGNRDKKAGALNQAWRQRFRRAGGDRRTAERRSTVRDQLGASQRRWEERRCAATGLPDAADHDLVLVQDADSRLDAGFLEAAARRILGDDALGAVGGTFRGEAGGGFVGHLQRNEYARYARDVRRLEGKCLVVTGTAAMFRVATLRRISAARRSGRLPRGDGHGGIYDTTVLTEDNELTFGILHLGYTVLSPRECTLVTEVMPTWRALWAQRLRWKRGAIENCFQYGLTRITWRYWARQLLTLLGVLVTFTYLGSMAWALAVDGRLHLQPFWVGVTGIFVVERVVTVRDRGWARMLAAACMYELLYDLFLQFVHAQAYADAALGRERRW